MQYIGNAEETRLWTQAAEQLARRSDLPHDGARRSPGGAGDTSASGDWVGERAPRAGPALLRSGFLGFERRALGQWRRADFGEGHVCAEQPMRFDWLSACWTLALYSQGGADTALAKSVIAR